MTLRLNCRYEVYPLGVCSPREFGTTYRRDMAITKSIIAKCPLRETRPARHPTRLSRPLARMLALLALLLLPAAVPLRSSWVNTTMYHINPLTYDPADLAEKDTGDLAGDLFFDISQFISVFACQSQHRAPGIICYNKETAGDKIGVTQVVVEVDAAAWGPYGTCNICINGTSPLNKSHTCSAGEYVCDCEDGKFPPKALPCTPRVGWENTSAFLGSGGIGKFCGYGTGSSKISACAGGAAADKLQGIWFSMPKSGQCKTSLVEETCYWRFHSVVKRIRRDCHSNAFLSVVEKRNPKCFDGCGSPRNTSSLCWAGCFVDTALGVKARSSCDPTGGMTAKELKDAWSAPFKSCPSA